MNLTLLARIPGYAEMTNLSTTTTITTTEAIDQEHLQHPGNWRYLGVMVGFLVVVLGSAGNGLTVWAYTRNKNLQTSFNILIANLCLVELFFSAVVMPLTLPGFLVGKSIYPAGFCSFAGYLYYISLACSLHNLVAIAVNRYVGIVRSEKYQQLFTGQRLAICIASIWLTAPILYLPVVIGDAISWREDSLRCAIGTNLALPGIQWYNMALNISFQAIPLVILIVLYTAIFKKVRAVQKKLKHHERASFRKSTKRSKASVSISKTIKSGGNTSDGTGDEFKPSSLIEGVGQGFKAVAIEKNSTTERSESSHVIKQEDEKSSHVNENSAFHDDNGYSTGGITASEDEDQNKQKEPSAPVRKKRNSLWQILLRNSRITTTTNNSIAEERTAPEISQSTDHSPTDDDLGSLSKSPTVNDSAHDLPKLEVEYRSNRLDIQDLRRKKSLSAPTLPNLDFTNPNLNNSVGLTSEVCSVLVTENERSEIGPLDGDSKMARSRSAFYKRNTVIHTSSSQNEISPLKTSTSWSLRLNVRKREWSNSWSHKPESGDETPRSRVGTIARKIQDRKHRASRKERKRKQKHRMLKKKHARERQLVYSSLTICIAYAVCILPTALLYLSQVLFGIDVWASTGLVVTCVAWFHAVINPIIYGYLNSQYRREYNRIFKCIKNKIFTSSDKACKHEG